MRNYIFLWIVAFVAQFPSPIECVNGSFLRFEPRQQSGYQLRNTTQYQGCVEDLFASDINGDLKVNEEEYVMFISSRSRGEIDVDTYMSLPFPLISNYVYGSCFCSYVTKIPNCCVGPEAGITLDIDSYPSIEDNLITICRTADQVIGNEIDSAPPTKSPTVSPTNTITEQPSGNPTAAPTKTITGQPSENPTAAPTKTITGQPSENPTVAPTKTITEQPSENPTVAPTLAPTVTPTNKPTIRTTTATSTGPTDPPSDDLLCVNFQYGIQNDQKLSTDDIENGVDNTYRSDLIFATRETIIQVLNEAFPRDQEGRFLRRDNFDGRPRFETFEDNSLLGVVNLSRFELTVGEDESMQGQRRAVILPSNPEDQTGTANNYRRLALYKDSYPPDILSIFDNTYCPESDEGFICSIVETRVCVVLEEGEDGDEVKKQLLGGIKKSFQDGSFENNLPSTGESV